jgi:hypothetical protein
MRNKLIYILGGFFIFLIVMMTFDMLGDISKKTEGRKEKLAEDQQVGGETDEYGCLVSAGYSWCDEKDKCVRIWEEGCDNITTLLAELNNITSEAFSQLSDTSFEWRGGNRGDTLIKVVGSSKTATAVTADMDYEIDHFFQSSGFIEDQFNLLDKTLPAKGYQKETIVCLVSSKKTDKNNPQAVSKRNPYDFIVKCGELDKKEK